MWILQELVQPLLLSWMTYRLPWQSSPHEIPAETMGACRRSLGPAWTEKIPVQIYPAGLGDISFHPREVGILAGTSTKPCSGSPRSAVAGDLLGPLAVLWWSSGEILKRASRRVRRFHSPQLESIGSGWLALCFEVNKCVIVLESINVLMFSSQ